jgi:lysophospholipase L1-like esterase
MRLPCLQAVALATTCLAVPSAAQMRPAVLDGVQRILFLGDSITQAGDYVADVDAWLVSRGIDVEVVNLGLASETATALTDAENDGHLEAHGFGRPFLGERLDRVLAAIRPDLVFACYGMNDAGSLPADETGDRRFAAAMTHLRDAALQAGARRVVLCTPPVHDARGDVSQASHDASLARYSAWLRSRRAQAWDVVDIHGPMRQALDERRARDPAFAFARDGVHPGPEGHWLMAVQILTQLLGADLAGVGSADQLFPNQGMEVRGLVGTRMRTLAAAWMTAIGHTRPGVPGGPGAAPGLPLQDAREEVAVMTRQIARARADGPSR